MFDRQLLALAGPLVDAAARRVNSAGITANQISFIGFGFGILASLMIAMGTVIPAVIPLIINRICDGLDGAIARIEGPTDRGAFLDITLDFLFYAGIPLAFAFCDPVRNALPAAALLASFIGTGVSFLAFAIMAEKRGKKSEAYPSKAFYYLGGLTEGTETIACFILMCLFRDWFSVLAYTYAAMCTVTTLTRMLAGWTALRP
jgi:phosphatidylglycerophosphate synthase